MAKETNWAVYWAVRDTMCWTVNGLVCWSMYSVLGGDVSGIVSDTMCDTVRAVVCDPKHPALQEFLYSYGIEVGV